MPVKFERSVYFNAIALDRNSIVREVQKELHFRYGNVSYQKFLTEYQNSLSDDHGHPKLGKSLWLVIQTIYHLAKLIFSVIPETIFFKNKHLKYRVYYIARDFQGLYGSIQFLSDKKNGLYHILESQFQKKCYDIFFDEFVKSTQRNLKAKSHPHYLKAEEYFKKGDLDNAVIEISYLSDANTLKEDFFAKVAGEYLRKGNLEKGLKTILTIMENQKVKEDFLIRIIEEYLKKGSLEEAIKAVKHLNDPIHKEKFFIKMADEYLKKGDLQKALNAIKQINNDQSKKDQYFLKIGEEHIKKGNLDHAFKIALEGWEDVKAKDIFITKIAEEHLKKGNLAIAFDTIMNIYDDDNLKEEFIGKIAEKHFAKKDISKALKVLKEIAYNEKIKNSFFIRIVEEDFKMDNFGSSFSAIQEISTEKTEELLINFAIHSFNINILNLILYNAVRTFHTVEYLMEKVKVQSNCFELAEKHFEPFSKELKKGREAAIHLARQIAKEAIKVVD